MSKPNPTLVTGIAPGIVRLAISAIPGLPAARMVRNSSRNNRFAIPGGLGARWRRCRAIPGSRELFQPFACLNLQGRSLPLAPPGRLARACAPPVSYCTVTSPTPPVHAMPIAGLLARPGSRPHQHDRPARALGLRAYMTSNKGNEFLCSSSTTGDHAPLPACPCDLSPASAAALPFGRLAC